MIEKTQRDTVDVELAQYEAARGEVLLRIKIQQDVINYAIVVAGLIAPLVGLKGTVGNDVLWLLLVGPLACVFLQIVYLKQHVYIQLLVGFIATRLSASTTDLNEDSPTLTRFAGWEVYLTRALDGHPSVRILSKFLGLAEGGIFTLIAALYLVTFGVFAKSAGLLRHRLPQPLLSLLVGDVAIVAVLALAGLVVQLLTASIRMKMSFPEKLKTKRRPQRSKK